MTNPHELINLRGYGSAEKALRKAGMWKLTPQERYSFAIEKSYDGIISAIDSIKSAAQDAEYELERAMEATT